MQQIYRKTQDQTSGTKPVEPMFDRKPRNALDVWLNGEAAPKLTIRYRTHLEKIENQ